MAKARASDSRIVPSARTRLAAIFGDPVEHSLSPAMHNAAYAALQMDRAYVGFRVRPEHLRAALGAIRALGLLGVNLTIPHKERAARMIRPLSREARLLGAVNCVVDRPAGLYGDNTDARGLEADLRKLGVGLFGKLVMLIGAGGGATAALLACLRMGTARVVIANRTAARAARLARRFSRGELARRRRIVEARGLEALVDRALLGEAALVINATSMGLGSGAFAPLEYEAAAPGCVFYDLVYAERPTAFLEPALRMGLSAYDGAGMLINQGELAFRLFNGIDAPEGVMRRALMDALGRRTKRRAPARQRRS